jgi:hypothetical protein
MFSWSVNDTSSIVRMMIVGDATTWRVILEPSCQNDDSRVVFYDRNIFIIQATGPHSIQEKGFTIIVFKYKIFLELRQALVNSTKTWPCLLL